MYATNFNGKIIMSAGENLFYVSYSRVQFCSIILMLSSFDSKSKTEIEKWFGSYNTIEVNDYLS